MKRKKVFIDSDVIISSLISSTGAAFYLLNNTNLELVVSDRSIEELEKVVIRLSLNSRRFKKLLKDRFMSVKLRPKEIDKVRGYTLDPDDAHILAGAKLAKSRFLVTYNIRHFKVAKIFEDLKIAVFTPAKFLQYLRSLQ